MVSFIQYLSNFGCSHEIKVISYSNKLWSYLSSITLSQYCRAEWSQSEAAWYFRKTFLINLKSAENSLLKRFICDITFYKGKNHFEVTYSKSVLLKCESCAREKVVNVSSLKRLKCYIKLMKIKKAKVFKTLKHWHVKKVKKYLAKSWKLLKFLTKS